jgi:F0F1-type ATP synthase assembly protein I
MRSGSPHSGDLSQDLRDSSAHRSPVTRTESGDASGSGKRFYDALSASSVGLELGLSVVLCVVLGLWLDGRLETRPWMTLLGLALGLTAGFRGLVRNIRRADRAAEREARQARGAREAPRG